MRAHQRIIREKHEREEPVERPVSLETARVVEIDRQTAKEIILKYEYLGTMGTTDYCFGLYFGNRLAGVACFGRTAGTKTAASVCGPEYAHVVRTLNRGACVHWAHPHSASFLITRACRMMVKKGFNVFIAYADPAAGEIGTIYQACRWMYCGMTKSASSMFVWAGKPRKPVKRANDSVQHRIDACKDGRARDERLISAMTRIRTVDSGAYRTLSSRRELRERLVAEGFIFYKASQKFRYVHFAGTKNELRELRAALKWEVMPYPKRLGS